MIRSHRSVEGGASPREGPTPPNIDYCEPCESVIVTFRALFEQPTNVETVEETTAGDGYAGMPNGSLVYCDGRVNAIHGWHLKETTLADVTVEVCDGTASMVDESPGYCVGTVGRFCPWLATVGAFEPANPPDDGEVPDDGGSAPGEGTGSDGDDSGAGMLAEEKGDRGRAVAADIGVGVDETIAVTLPNTGRGAGTIGLGNTPLVGTIYGVAALVSFALRLPRRRVWVFHGSCNR